MFHDYECQKSRKHFLFGLPLKVNPASQQFTNSKRVLHPEPLSRKGSNLQSQHTETEPSECTPFKGDPWSCYFRILTEESDGLVTIAYK